LAGIFSIIPENLRPTSNQIERILEEYSQEEKSIEIALDDDIESSVCCQHLIDFWENHFLINLRNLPKYDECTEIAINEALADNCKSYIEELRNASKRNPKSKIIVEEFDKCVAGEDFDFISKVKPFDFD
jgi:hypothetical protein